MNFTFLKKSTTLLFLGVFSITLSSNAQTTDSTETIQLISTSVIQFPTDSTKIDSSENKLTTSNNSNILFNYKEPKKFKVAGIEINGTQYLDKNIIRSLTGIKIGDAVTVPGDDLTKSIKNLWKQGLFGDIKIFADKVEGELIYLSIDVQEKPRLNDISIKGLKKSEADDLKKKFELLKGKPLTDALKVNIKNIIVDKYEEKSYLNPIIDIKDKKDEGLVNSASLIVTVDKGNKVKINNIDFIGREYGELSKMRKAMKGTKERSKVELRVHDGRSRKQKAKDALYTLANLNSNSVKDFFMDRFRITFKGSKFNETKYEEDKQNLINYYNNNGFRDAKILADTVNNDDDGNVSIKIYLDEGNKYYFRNIDFKGNAKISNEILAKVLNIKKGDPYNAELLEKRLSQDPDGSDISSLYYDDGYLFFSINPVEVAVENDSIDLEIRINEGPQATIRNVIIEGNDKTNEHVIRRELRTYPGDKFSRSDLIRSQREIANLGFFDPQETRVEPIPNPSDGTVDIKYTVKEKSADQVELSAGWGGKEGGLIGTLGLKFNNFSLRNIFNKKAWTPLPTGDGQQLSIRIESNGKRYQNYNFSFTEPWLGGKKPNAFTIAAFRSRIQDVSGRTVLGKQITNGLSVSLGTRLKKPDDFFIVQASANYYGYKLDNFGQRYFVNNQALDSGKFSNLNFKLSIQRNSINQPIFPTSGAKIEASVQFTPPYSLFNKGANYDGQSIAQKYKLIEYHKWKFSIDWYQQLGKSKLVLRTAAKFGFLGTYNKKIGITPFERFQVGGNGIPSNVTLFGTDIVAHRGFEGDYSNSGGDPIYNKFLLELRYPFSLNPSATIYGLVFFEAANTYATFKDYNPFKLKKSVGIGVRAILPMFGLIGIDYGIRFDSANGSPIKQYNGFFDYIGKNGNISFILGFEPE
ncbi:MAG TPA: POTRA domain-containing protein [Chitinophagales bacterium]|jgi:outer membrane protein insertion porin family|nr:BamA/TamA family outer membrane protein [Chitinophagales bacterium]HQV76958.1 POTRA domain-containing protein [Chitinophagales bacterium]HQW77975.1 POTRA domain-containing protein [Chitinophagales bacterium]HRB66807.1 POTRA domain-containing protein [Chitinophagales bacterium]